ncbi:(d)CMP kinase [Mangrovibacillus cuniculi]|uniref:Cytidylate kinase n=1 Tax=Mangrovibacillus cuniculi TaxID=2593652 RepID=A0A7S8HFR3_9BACI|nr:(d)CMP kinase [Mangrovibacillus cuniculi]QPC46715.1 (d)CMP kinase [Mangrovibacillus cuniculi]
MTKQLRIAIDGPAAAGKSTVAKIVAAKLGYVYIDTGAMYRAITLSALRQDINLNDEKELIKLLKNTSIDLKTSDQGQRVFVNNHDVTDAVRENEVTNSVSYVAKHKLIREEMVERQQQLASMGGVVMDGRDIGTHVIPDAEVKVFLLASVEERAVRRLEDNKARGISSTLEELKREIAARDKIDSEREVAPLKKADDAIELDTTSLSINEVVDRIMAMIGDI